MATARQPRPSTTTLTLTEADLRLLRGIVGFASESDTYHDDDAHLDRLYRRLDRALARVTPDNPQESTR